MKPVFVISAARTPIGKFGGSFAAMSAADLGEVGRPCGPRAFGASAGRGGRNGLRSRAPGRRRAQYGAAGLAPRRAPRRVPAFTVNKACASSLQGDPLGALSIAAGENDIVLAGGTECMSATPTCLPRARFGLADGPWRDRGRDVPRRVPLPAVRSAHGRDRREPRRDYGIPRAEQDAYAAEWQRRAEDARAGRALPRRDRAVDRRREEGRPARVETDEHPRPAPPPSRWRGCPRSSTRRTGRSTRATPRASPTAPPRCVLAARRRSQTGVEPLARIAAGRSARRRSRDGWGSGPCPPSEAARRRTGLRLADIDLIELNEAFAAQVIACARELPHGSRPRQRQRRSDRPGSPDRRHRSAHRVDPPARDAAPRARLGLATLCVSGGMGMAVLFERT